MSGCPFSPTALQSWGLFISGCYLVNKAQQKRRHLLESLVVSLHEAEERIKSIERFVQADPGKRGIAAIIPPFPSSQVQSTQGKSHLECAAHAMVDCTHAVIMTGFPCLLDHTPPTETDGPLGALCLARCLVALGKKVHLITDECNEEALLACVAASGIMAMGTDGEGGYLPLLELESFPPMPTFAAEDHARLLELGRRADLVIAIERAGPSADGRYLTMRGRDMSAICAPLDELLQPEGAQTVFGQDLSLEMDRMLGEGDYGEGTGAGADFAENVSAAESAAATGNIFIPASDSASASDATSSSRMVSIGIGDGGNEVGMGAVYDLILASTIPLAETIACVVPTDHILVASVSNWGGYALAAATAVLATLSGSSVMYGKGVGTALSVCLPSKEEEMHMCVRLVESGARDGMTGKQEAMVDGMSMQTSVDILQGIKSLAMS